MKNINIQKRLSKLCTAGMLAFGGLFYGANASAIELMPSGGSIYGYSGAMGDDMALLFRYGSNIGGTAYLYRGMEGRTQTTENFILEQSSSSDNDWFGVSASIADNTALIGAYGYKSGSIQGGAAYLYRDLATRAQATEDLMLYASDGADGNWFGAEVLLADNSAYISATRIQNGVGYYAGAVYIYRNIDTRTQATEDLKLIASDTAASSMFGDSLAQTNNTLYVGAYGTSNYIGAVYVFNNISERTQTTEDFKLTASDGTTYSYFGMSLSADNDILAVGASRQDYSGAVYVYKNLANLESGSTEDLKLVASDRAASYDDAGANSFGSALSMSGNNLLVGASGFSLSADFGMSSSEGAAYLYLNMDSRTQTTEDIRIMRSNAQSGDNFGSYVALDGDTFLITTGYSNYACAGSIASISTLNDGTSKVISGISFKSNIDWVIGDTASGNSLTLSAGDTANITENGKAVYIGKSAGSDNNSLIIAGILEADNVYVGNADNAGNQLYIANGADISGVENILLSVGSSLFFEDAEEIFAALGVSLLYIDSGEDAWVLVDATNYAQLVSDGYLDVSTESNGLLITSIAAVPEPSTVAAILGVLALGFAAYRKRRQN